MIMNRAPSTSTYVQRISADQARIEARLVELVGVDEIRQGLQNTTIDGEGIMSVDATSPSDVQPPISTIPSMSRAISAKQRALARWVRPESFSLLLYHEV